MFFYIIFFTHGIKIQNGGKMKRSFVHYIACGHLASQNIRQIQAYHRKNLLLFHYTKMLLFTAKAFLYTKLQTRVNRVVLSKFLYLIANWSSDPKPIEEMLAVLQSAIK